MTKYDVLKAEDSRLAAQAQAEYEFALSLEESGNDTESFRYEMGLSVHQFNVLAHYIYGVNDEEPALTPQARALIVATRQAQSNTAKQAVLAM